MQTIPSSPIAWAGAARSLCFLDQHEKHGLTEPLQPLGLFGWEVHLPGSLAEELGAFIPEGRSGRDLLVAARAETSAHGRARSEPGRPLLVRLTHRSLRVLYHCAIGEAMALGRRLGLLAAESLAPTGIVECPPAILSDLFAHYLRADPRMEAMLGPSAMEVQARTLTPWDHPFSAARVLTSQAGEPISLREGWGLDFGGELNADAAKEMQSYFRIQAYAKGHPTVLCPVTLTIDPPGFEDQYQMARALSQPRLWQPLFDDCLYPHLPSRLTPMVAALLLPLRDDNWRPQLLRLRDEASRLLGRPAGFLSTIQEDLFDVAQDLFPLIPRLLGAAEVETAPQPGRKRAIPVDRAFELCALIMGGLDISFDPARFMPLPS